ncbi:hypothetical protein NUKP33_26320 [Klebsiella variicola]|nr:hypothetical protein NUKP33_26320 [Klebsiella variicola]
MNKLTAGRTNRRPDKRSAIRHKGGYGAGGVLPGGAALAGPTIYELTGGSRRPDKCSAIRHETGTVPEVPARRRCAFRVGEWDSAERFAKKHLPPSNKKAG